MSKYDGQKDRLQSDWNATQLDMERYDAMLVSADEFAFICRMGDVSSLLKYYSMLVQIYMNLKTITSEKQMEETTKKLNEIRPKVYLTHKVFTEKRKTVRGYDSIFSVLEEVHSELLNIRQQKGLGVLVSRYMTPEERMAAAMR